MSKWLKILLFAIILGIAKAHNFVKLVILAGLGLAGLWMVHTLAQDFQNIQEGGSFNLNNHNDLRTNNGGGGGGGGGGLGVNLFKRSIPEPKARPNSINWELVLSRDPASCARSFLCQLAALDEKTLSKDEKLMLSLVRYSAKEENWASKQLQDALKSGEKVVKPSQCMKIYKFCPYSSNMMMTLLKFFGR